MFNAEAVLVCALTMLGRSPASFPAVSFVDTPPPGVSARAEAFVRDGDRRIVLVTASALFRDALHAGDCSSHIALTRKLASVLVHEEWHLNHGADETGAYAAQLTALEFMGAGPNSSTYDEVKHAMLVVEKRQRSHGLMARRE